MTRRKTHAPDLQHAVLDEAHDRAAQLQDGVDRTDQPVTGARTETETARARSARRTERHAVSLFSELDGGGVRFEARPPERPQRQDTSPGSDRRPTTNTKVTKATKGFGQG